MLLDRAVSGESMSIHPNDEDGSDHLARPGISASCSSCAHVISIFPTSPILFSHAAVEFRGKGES